MRERAGRRLGLREARATYFPAGTSCVMARRIYIRRRTAGAELRQLVYAGTKCCARRNFINLKRL